MDRSRLLAPGLWMLSVAPVVTMVRAILVVAGVAEPAFYWIGFAVGGTLSGVGMLLLCFGVWGTPAFGFVVAGATTALLGHNVLPVTPVAILGPALVTVGTGLALGPWRPWIVGTGLAGGLAMVLRHGAPVFGNVVVALAAIGFLIAIVGAARQATMHRGTATQHATPDSNMFMS